jgi:hypothetical protein
MNIGDSVYFVDQKSKAGAGLPGLISELNDSTAKVAVELEEGTVTYVVPLWDVLPARLFTAQILRTVYGVYGSLERYGRSPRRMEQSELERELSNAGLDQKAAEVCAGLAREVDWAAQNPLSTWLKAIRAFYL